MNRKDESVWLVIPAYNEAAVIGETLRAAFGYFSRAVLVDDCSVDATSQIAYEAGADVCRHPINLGQGAALQTGIDYALRHGASKIVTFDADGQHSPHEAARMVDELDQAGCDVVVASRFKGSAEGISTAKRYFLKLATFYTRLTTGWK